MTPSNSSASATDTAVDGDEQGASTAATQTTATQTTVTQATALDAGALAVAREAAVEEAESTDAVGALIDAHREGDVTVAVRFEAFVEGYRGWAWSVTLAQLPDQGATVSEVVLLPGPDALLAPEWIPWQQRIESGDLGVGDVLPTAPDDVRLVPAYLESDDPAVEDVAHELGVGRPRVMSREGRLGAAKRWRNSTFGPYDEMALAAPGHCGSCAFYLPLAGSLGGGFGACGNKYSPADGRVVNVGYGCGAHSEATLPHHAADHAAPTVVDELQLEVHERVAPASVEPGDAPAE